MRCASIERSGGCTAARRDLDLEEMHGALQVAESMLAEIDEVAVVAHELLDDASADDLPAVGDRHHPGGAVDLGAEPVALALGGLTCVQAHPNAKRDVVGPLASARARAAPSCAAPAAVSWRGEHGVQAVAPPDPRRCRRGQ